MNNSAVLRKRYLCVVVSLRAATHEVCRFFGEFPYPRQDTHYDIY